jgi:GT2 family glycosyltransferase
MSDTITVILNGYKRGHCLTEQYDSLQNQTITPNEILLWYNSPGEGHDVNYDIMEKVPTAFSNINMGVWARFAYALNAKSEYVCIYDDDMVSGKRWLENCLNTIKQVNGLLGAVGVLYLLPNPPQYSCYYEKYIRLGWVPGGQNEVPVQVDLVGHVWFFKKEWLTYFWRELPDPKYNICGEDMHFSYMLQKYANIKTYVPPHPTNNTELWGNVINSKYATDKHSLWESNQQSVNGTPFKHIMNDFFVEQRRKGWKLINETK